MLQTFWYENFRKQSYVRHSLAYLNVQKWLTESLLFYLKFWNKVTHLCKNDDS